MSHPMLARELREAIGKHGAWKLKLKTSVTIGKAMVPSKEAECCDCCDFGRWLAAPEQVQDLGQTVQYRVINRLHREFHQCAARVIKAIEDGDTVKAARILDTEFVPQSDHLVRGISKWASEAD